MGKKVAPTKEQLASDVTTGGTSGGIKIFKDKKGNRKVFARDFVDFEFSDKAKHATGIQSIHLLLAEKFEKEGKGKIIGKTEDEAE